MYYPYNNNVKLSWQERQKKVIVLIKMNKSAFLCGGINVSKLLFYFKECKKKSVANIIMLIIITIMRYNDVESRYTDRGGRYREK